MEAATRCAVVTGAATGIGRATAHAFARNGYAVALVGRRAEPLEEVADELRRSGGDAIAAPADVAAPEQAAAAIGTAVERLGGIDALVNNAGVEDSGPLLEESLERWEETLRINLTGAFLITQLALPHLIERRGAVVNVASVNGILAGARLDVVLRLEGRADHAREVRRERLRPPGGACKLRVSRLGADADGRPRHG